MSRKLHIEVFRYNPLDPASVPHMQSFYVEEYSSMTLFIALNIIREQQDPSLQFDFCCRAGICGSCGMVINGRPGLACHTQTRDLPDHIVLHPLPVFKLLGDLSVDTGVWFTRRTRRSIPAPKKSAWKTSLPSRFSSSTAASNAAAASRPAVRPGCARTSSARRPSTASPVSTSIPATTVPRTSTTM